MSIRMYYLALVSVEINEVYMTKDSYFLGGSTLLKAGCDVLLLIKVFSL